MGSLTFWAHCLGFGLTGMLVAGEREMHVQYLLCLVCSCAHVLYMVRAIRLYNLRMAYERLRITMDKHHEEWKAIDYMRTQLRKEGYGNA